MAGINLNHTEKAILARGLKFIPAPDMGDISAIMSCHRDFSRKVKLSYFFHNKENRRECITAKFKEKSSWEPDGKLIPTEILDELEKLKVKLGNIWIHKEKPNLSQEEYEALIKLRNRDDLVFKKADKGNAIVIMSREQYIDEAISQLSNERYYMKIEEPVYTQTFEEVKAILGTLQEYYKFTASQMKYLSPSDEAKPRTFYLLPKIHKTMDKWPVPLKRPPGRPIVSDISSDSYHYSELLDHVLKPLSNIHPSYIKDTDDFLEKIRGLEIENEDLLVTFDVESLYTNIQPGKGLEALEKVYKRAGLHMPLVEIKRLLELSLTHNDFQFDGQWYLQVSGTAMGKKYAPNYANIFMANFEFEVLEKAPHKPKFYGRFLDDGFMLWQHGRKQLDKLLEIFNSHDESIKIKAEISDMSVDFLDVTVFKGPRFKNHNILDTKVHFKPTDTHELLDHHSFHPKHTFHGIIKSQLIRFLKICNNMNDFHDACSQLFKALRQRRHYSTRFLRKIKSDILNRYRQTGECYDPLGASLKCGKRWCECCLRLAENSYFGSGEFEFPIFGRLDCQSRNIIYVIECKHCHIQYVGETQRPLAARLHNHISDVNLFLDKPIPDHFNYDCHRLGADNLIIYPIEYIPEQGSTAKNKALRLKREAYWIRQLGTQHPDGLDKRLPVKRIITFSLPYNQASGKALTHFRETFEAIRSQFPTKFTDDLICAFRRNKNIGDYLVSAKLK